MLRERILELSTRKKELEEERGNEETLEQKKVFYAAHGQICNCSSVFRYPLLFSFRCKDTTVCYS